MRAHVTAVLLVIFVIEAALSQSYSPEVRQYLKTDAPVLALTHVRIIDGTGAAARENQTIIINRGRIESVGDLGTTSIPDAAQKVDLEGRTVIPGLVGMHDHMF